MSNLRGATSLWASTAVGAGNTSPMAYVGSAPYVVVMISNETATSTNIDIQVSGLVNPVAGLNATPSTWFPLNGKTGITVAGNTQLAVDLSPFAAPYIRLKSSAATTITAFVESNG